MEKILLLCSTLLFISGCSKTFYAVSIADSAAGGLYAINSSGSSRHLAIPRSNYIIRHKDKLYITQNAARKSSDRSGILNTVDVRTMKIKHQIPVNGITPCHLTVSPDGKFLYTANYSSGSLSEIPLKEGIPCPPVRTISHTGKSVHWRRQKSPHPHFTGFAPDGRQLFVCDLGTDEIWIYDFIPGKGVAVPAAERLKLPPGSGPRHLVFAPDGRAIYTANELNSTVSSFIKGSPAWKIVKTVSTRQTDNAAKKNFPGAIKISSCGKYFFITNRGDDTIAMFKTSGNGDFELLSNIPSPGQYPSDMILSKDEKTLQVINLKSGTAARFKLNKAAGTLETIPGTVSIPRGISLCD